MAYRYYCINRPPGIAQIPDGFSKYEIWMPGQRIAAGAPGHDPDRYQRWYLGWVEYPEALTTAQIWKWELDPVDPLAKAWALLMNDCGGNEEKARETLDRYRAHDADYMAEIAEAYADSPYHMAIIAILQSG